jgi:metal-responsive CopG/Arc/MetJ family transcriptional regulator
MTNMPAKPVQISLDTELLRRIDRDAEARQLGRSAFVRSAVLLYLESKRRRDIDERIHKAFAGKADGVSAEVEEFVAAQAWPKR